MSAVDIDQGHSRRGAIDRFIAVSAGVFTAYVARSEAANATYPWACCDLGSTTNCSGSGSDYTCPQGKIKKSWHCCAGNRIYGCGECVDSDADSCFDFPFACSEGWTTGAVC